MSGRGQNRGKHSLCFACDEPSNVWLDSDLFRSADYCFQCFCMQSTWEEASRVFFNKPTMVRLLDLRFKAEKIAKFNRRVLEWEEKYGKPYNLEAMPANVIREEKHMDPNWFPELHEVCHL